MRSSRVLSRGWVYFNLAVACACVYVAFRWRPQFLVYEVSAAFAYAALVSYLFQGERRTGRRSRIPGALLRGPRRCGSGSGDLRR